MASFGGRSAPKLPPVRCLLWCFADLVNRPAAFGLLDRPRLMSGMGARSRLTVIGHQCRLGTKSSHQNMSPAKVAILAWSLRHLELRKTRHFCPTRLTSSLILPDQHCHAGNPRGLMTTPIEPIFIPGMVNDKHSHEHIRLGGAPNFADSLRSTGKDPR